MKHILVYGMTDNPGGIETYLLNFFLRVQDRLVHMDFVSDFPAIAHSHIFEQRGAKMHFIPAKSKNLFGHLRAMWRILKNHKEYETVYFNILDAGAAVTMVPVFLLGRKIVVHSHNGSTDKVRLHGVCKPILNWIAGKKVACSKVAANHMFVDGDANCLIIPNGIDAAGFSYSPEVRSRKRRELKVEDKLVICHVGRISSQKNPLRLVDVFSKVKEQYEESVMISVGFGEMMEQFQAHIKHQNLEESIMCLGIRRDVREILQAADVFLFPSFYEGLPISLLEAQAAGLSCVISDTISQESIITDRVCVLSLEQDDRTWADAVLKAAEIPRKDTYSQIVAAGFDISCCESFDEKLLADL